LTQGPQNGYAGNTGGLRRRKRTGQNPTRNEKREGKKGGVGRL